MFIANLLYCFPGTQKATLVFLNISGVAGFIIVHVSGTGERVGLEGRGLRTHVFLLFHTTLLYFFNFLPWGLELLNLILVTQTWVDSVLYANSQ